MQWGKGHVICVELLIQAGADVNKVDKYGDTILMSTAASGSTKLVSMMLHGGAKINCLSTGPNPVNALTRSLTSDCQNERVIMLLYAAGETIEGTTVAVRRGRHVRQISVPDYLLHEDLKLNLKRLAREVIRNRLIELNPH